MKDFDSSERINDVGIKIRKKILNSLHSSGGGHFGGSMSVADILLTLYYKTINFGKDRVILSKGHAAIALYSVLSEFNYIDEDTLENYGQFNSGFEGHPDMLVTPAIDFSSGSLGQGLSVGLGMAISLRASNNHVWVVLGDGECQEGQVWEAAMLASRYNVNNLHVVVDSNGAQECGFKFNQAIPQEPITDMKQKWKAFGWEVIEIDGHSYIELEKSCQESIKNKSRPVAIIANTKKGFGIKLFENNPELYHCSTLTEEEYQLALSDLEAYK